ncbi:alpha amylase family protein [Desertivirga xinjiangensis]|uniref:alpha amylase family protein n=1 Tax=Desertivirga xinjiangensis TaxID=539206 RepID=UPI00210960EE
MRFDWAVPGYKDSGLAEELDLLMTGNYFTQLLINDNPASTGLAYHWWSIEGSINGGNYVTKDKLPLYGSIDMGNLSWASQGDLSKAIKLVLSKSDGVMLFDVVHAYSPPYNRMKVSLWNAIKAGTSAD